MFLGRIVAHISGHFLTLENPSLGDNVWDFGRTAVIRNRKKRNSRSKICFENGFTGNGSYLRQRDRRVRCETTSWVIPVRNGRTAELSTGPRDPIIFFQKWKRTRPFAVRTPTQPGPFGRAFIRFRRPEKRCARAHSAEFQTVNYVRQFRQINRPLKLDVAKSTGPDVFARLIAR